MNLNKIHKAIKILSADSSDYLLGGSLTMRNGRIDKLQFDEGYCQATRYNNSQDNFTFYYYNRDHLGSIRQVTKADRITNGTVVQSMNYYPFGAQFCDGSTDSNVQSHKHNGKEFDRMHGLNTYDYGARQYNPVTARWDRVDPLCEKYYSVSPYSYCANNPVRYIDPDGEKILFINGYWASGWIGNLIGSDQCGKGYWGAGFDKAAQSFFKDWTPINSTNYIDGSSLFGGDMSGQDRYVAGYFFAKQHLDELTSNMSPNEGFNMVTHSEGAAYGAGVAQYLISQGYSVNTILHLSADEGDEFDTPKEPYTIQLSYDRDWVTNNHIMKSTDRYGIIDRGNLKGFYVHGATKSRYIFKAAEDLLSVKIEQTIGELNGRVYTGEQQVAGSTRYNTIFKNVNGHILDIHR